MGGERRGGRGEGDSCEEEKKGVEDEKEEEEEEKEKEEEEEERKSWGGGGRGGEETNPYKPDELKSRKSRVFAIIFDNDPLLQSKLA